ncbi:MAG: GNAT family N-acetyltransferase [Flavobacteriaceae bacterium]|jgi:[ribosomal protein S5]-alanine N-acetyltransferase|nr:GNAT family N-acetyltransferase [Flavobacteriaceae bacterium]
MNKLFFKKLEGSLVELSLFTENDITQDYITWLNDSSVMQFSNQRFVKHDLITCQNYLSSFKNTDNLFILIKTKRENKAIGTMNAYVNAHHGVVDFGILIGNKAQWGKGYGQDAWNTLTSWVLEIDGVRKITAGTLSCNFGMLKLLERSGMSLEATKKKQEVIDNKVFDAHYFCKFKG